MCLIGLSLPLFTYLIRDLISPIEEIAEDYIDRTIQVLVFFIIPVLILIFSHLNILNTLIYCICFNIQQFLLTNVFLHTLLKVESTLKYVSQSQLIIVLFSISLFFILNCLLYFLHIFSCWWNLYNSPRRHDDLSAITKN